MGLARGVLVIAAALSVFAFGGERRAAATPVGVPLIGTTSTDVTIYGATWCGPCHILEKALRERDIPFIFVDVDHEGAAYAKARRAAGTNSIPLTSVERGMDRTWIVGANPDAVEKAYRDE